MFDLNITYYNMMYIACINVIPSFVKCQISYPLKEKKMTSILCVFIKSLEEDKKTMTCTILKAKRNYTLLFFYFQCQC